MSSLSLRTQVDAQLAAQRAQGHWLQRFGRSAVAAVFSFETLFILYVWSGLYKSDPALAWVPGDLTAILFFVSIAAGVLILLREGLRLRPAALTLLWLTLALAAWLFITTLWSPSQAYATRKAMYFPTLSLWAVFAASFIIARSELRLRRFFAMLTVFALFVTLAAAWALKASFLSGNFKVLIRALGSHYGTLGVMVATGVVLLLLYNLYYVKKPWLKLAVYGLIAGIMVMLLFMGSRTSFVVPILGAIFPLALNFRWPRTPGKLLAWLAAAVLAVFLLAALWNKVVNLIPGGPTTLRRFETLERRGIESEGRFRNIASARRVISDTSNTALVFGHGIGSWPILIGMPDVQVYPHNLSVELLVELGLVGLLIFWLMILHSARNLGSLRSICGDPPRVFLLTLFVTMFVIAHVSGDLHENRALFVMMGLMTWDWRRDRLPSKERGLQARTTDSSV